MFVTIIQEALHLGAVFLYGSTGETIIEKSGHLNLGIPGIMCFGGIGGCMGAYLAMKGGPLLTILVAILFAMLFAGAMGFVYGLFTISLRCNQNVTGLVITTFGVGALGVWSSRLGAKEMTYAFVKPSIYFTTSLFGNSGDAFSKMFLSHGILVYLSLIIAIIVAVVLRKTRTGLNLNAVGENPAAADAAGINVKKYKYVACVLGAAVAGLGGAFYFLDNTRGIVQPGVIDAMGWLAVALVIFSLWRPGIGIFGSFIFGLLYIAPAYISGIDFAEKEILKMVPYAVTALALILISFFKKRETQPPSALGLSYFREDR